MERSTDIASTVEVQDDISKTVLFKVLSVLTIEQLNEFCESSSVSPDEELALREAWEEMQIRTRGIDA